MRYLLFIAILGMLIFSCDDEETEMMEPTPDPQLVFKFKFDPDQARLDNVGQPATIPAGHAAQTPNFNAISANYIELAPDALTLLGAGEIVYNGPETTTGGSNAIDFDQAIIV